MFHANIQSVKINIRKQSFPKLFQSVEEAPDLYCYYENRIAAVSQKKNILSKMSFDTPWPMSFKLVCQNDLKETKLLFWGSWWNMKHICPGAALSEEGSTQAPVVYT